MDTPTSFDRLVAATLMPWRDASAERRQRDGHDGGNDQMLASCWDDLADAMAKAGVSDNVDALRGAMAAYHVVLGDVIGWMTRREDAAALDVDSDDAAQLAMFMALSVSAAAHAIATRLGMSPDELGDLPPDPLEQPMVNVMTETDTGMAGLISGNDPLAIIEQVISGYAEASLRNLGVPAKGTLTITLPAVMLDLLRQRGVEPDGAILAIARRNGWEHVELEVRG